MSRRKLLVYFTFVSLVGLWGCTANSTSDEAASTGIAAAQATSSPTDVPLATTVISAEPTAASANQGSIQSDSTQHATTVNPTATGILSIQATATPITVSPTSDVAASPDVSSEFDCPAPCESFKSLFEDLVGINQSVSSFRMAIDFESIPGTTPWHEDSGRLVNMGDVWVGELTGSTGRVDTEHCVLSGSEPVCTGVYSDGGTSGSYSPHWYTDPTSLGATLSTVLAGLISSGTGVDVRQEMASEPRGTAVTASTSSEDSSVELRVTLEFDADGYLIELAIYSNIKGGNTGGTVTYTVWDHNTVDEMAFEEGGPSAFAAFE